MLNSTKNLSHMATARVRSPFETVYGYLADPLKLGLWSLGCFDTRATEAEGVFVGTSLYDGSQAWIKIAADKSRGLIDFHVGTPDHLVPRISARIVPGAHLELPLHHCVVSLIAWRSAGMSDERWERLCAAHEAEIGLIKAQIENL